MQKLHYFGRGIFDSSFFCSLLVTLALIRYQHLTKKYPVIMTSLELKSFTSMLPLALAVLVYFSYHTHRPCHSIVL